MNALLLLAWLVPLLLAAAGLARSLWWAPALAPLPALAAALWLPIGAQLEIPSLLLGSRLGLDEVGRLFLAFTAVLWLAAGLYAAQSLKDQPHAGRFRAYFLLAMGGNLWLILAQDLVGFYTGFALMGLASYGLVIHHGDRRALRAGRVYLTMTLMGELALFCALVLIAAQTGTLSPGPEQLTDLRDLTIGLLLLGLAIKAGLVPLHVWLPLAHPAAPVPASAVLSGAMIKVALLGWLRFLPVGQVALPEWGLLLIFAGLITLFFAIPIGMVQSDPKVILAYSSVSKMGFLTLILGLMLLEPTLAPGGVLALVLYAAHHALAKGGLFLGVGLRHHAAFQPLVLVGLALLALSMAGTPASGGAVAKYGLKPVLMGPNWSWLGAAVTLGAVGTTFLMGRFLWVIWHTEPHPTQGYVWGGAAWVLLVGLLLLYPVVLGSPAAWFSGTGPIGIAAAVVALMALVAWRKPRLLSPLVDKVGPGDLLALVRPVLAVFLLLGRTLWRAWVGILKGVQMRLEGLLAPLGRLARDPEHRLRDWPTAGGLWLGVVSLLLAVLLVGGSQAPLLDSRPERSAEIAAIGQAPGGEDIASGGAITEGVEAPARGAAEAPSTTMTTPDVPPPRGVREPEGPSATESEAAPTASVHAESPGPATEITETPERGPPAEEEVAGLSAAWPREAEAAASARSQDAQSPVTATESP
ncbi:MAG: proton-conducting transporter membrane subunit, partial [Bdellovibrio bacteriovorus]